MVGPFEALWLAELVLRGLQLLLIFPRQKRA